MSIKTYQVTYDSSTSNGLVPAVADRRLYEHLLLNDVGIAEGVNIQTTGTSLIVSSGWGVIKGAVFEIEQETIQANVPATGTVPGRLLIELDVTNSAIRFITQQGETLPALVQEDINVSGSIYQLPLATYNISSVAISDLQTVYPTLKSSTEFKTEVGEINARLQTAESKLSGIQTGAQVNTVTGVKGSAESAYKTGNVDLSPANIGAVPTSRKVNNKALSSDITLSASDVSAVPTTRKVNNHALSADVTVTKSDVGLSKVNNNAITMSLSGTTLTITYS